jgi:hypothetical protein
VRVIGQRLYSRPWPVHRETVSVEIGSKLSTIIEPETFSEIK